MKCASCGAEIGNDDRFCPECGKPVEPSPEAQETDTRKDVPAAQEGGPAGVTLDRSYVRDSSINMSLNVGPSGSGGPPQPGAPHEGITLDRSYIKDSSVSITENIDRSVHVTENRITNVTAVETTSMRLLAYRQAFFDLILQLGPEQARNERERLAVYAASLELPNVVLLEQEELALKNYGEQMRTERTLKRYHLKVGEQLVTDRTVSLNEVVAYLNRRGSVDGPIQLGSEDGQWVSAWTIAAFVQHPELDLTCPYTGERLASGDVHLCPGCGVAAHESAFVAPNGLCPKCEKEAGKRKELGELEEAAASARKEDMVSKTAALSEDRRWTRIPEGTFVMGSPESEEGRGDDERQHIVHITRPLYVLKIPVSESLYHSVLGDDASRSRDDYPMTNVSWLDAIDFCNAFSRKLGLSSLCYEVDTSSDVPRVTWDRKAEGIRLLSEAEWEYACRAGSTGSYPLTEDGSEITEEMLDSIASFDEDELVPLGDNEPNRFGLYDMLGCIREWVWDQKCDYPSEESEDPASESDSAQKVTRGGSYADDEHGCRCANRSASVQTYRSRLVGFRVATYAVLPTE